MNPPGYNQLSLREILRAGHRHAAIFGVTFKSEDQFHFAQPTGQASVNGADNVWKIEGRFSPTGPTPSGSKKFLGARISNKQLHW